MMIDVRYKILLETCKENLYVDNMVYDGFLDNIYDAMDAYAVEIVKWLSANKIDFSSEAETDIKELIKEINVELQTENQ